MSETPKILHRSEWREWESSEGRDVETRDKWAREVINDESIKHVTGGGSMVFAQRDSDGTIWVYDCIVRRACFAIVNPDAAAQSLRGPSA